MIDLCYWIWNQSCVTSSNVSQEEGGVICFLWDEEGMVKDAMNVEERPFPHC